MRRSKVGLILQRDNRSWVIEKIAYRLQEHVVDFGFDAEIADHPLPSATVNHHMSWAFANSRREVPSTMFITHLDDVFKLRQVKSELENFVDVGICMSSDTVRQLTTFGVPSKSLCFIPPAHDGLVEKKRIVIGIMTRIYSDGRKREDFLVRLAKEIRLDLFEFRIFGNGWEKVISRLEEAGAKVVYFKETDDFRKDYEILLRGIHFFDYYLYLGMDEGSLGTLDALAAGVKTIITPQGFHLDIPHGITHPVLEYEDVLEVFRSLAYEHSSRIRGVSNLNWREYARRHVILWDQLIQGGSCDNIQNLLFVRPEIALNDGLQHAEIGSRLEMYRRSITPRRIVSAFSRLTVLRPLRALFLRGK